jgi:UDP-N-acetylglucosamine--N-acetylmuramyl-(pentapeptide) pyrophosphoryl-undecaprenol N-acetylglucosamine transferase
MSKKILFAGGGTAGHVEPALATADALALRHPDWELRFIGTATGIESRLVPARGYPLDLISRVPLPRRLNADLLVLPFRLVNAIRQTRQALRGVDCLVGFGSYVSMPAYIAARLMQIPIVVHEQNARPGIANRIGARWAKSVGATFAQSGLPGVRVMGLPLRRAFADMSLQIERDRGAAQREARSALGLAQDKPVLVITGGSQGSARVNQAVAEALPQLLEAGWQIIHAVGERNALPATQPGYFPSHYLNEMQVVLASADLMVGRSGAGTCAEAAALGVPAIFVPLPIGNGEQMLNAREAVSVGGAVVVADNEFFGNRLVSEVNACWSRIDSMRNALSGLSRLGAAEELATMIEGAVND